MAFNIRKHPLFRIYEIVLLFIALLLFGIAGFMLVEHYTFMEAFYMTVITVATVGFEEVHPLSENGRLFTIILILVTLVVLSFFASYLTRYFLDGHFQRTYKLYKMKQKIQQLRQHVIVCGFGRNGQAAAKILSSNKMPVVVIEQNQSMIDNADWPIEYYLIGDSTKDDVLTDAGIMNAKAMLITLPEDADNVFIVLTARELNPALKIISRASNDSSVSKMRTAGASNVIMPDKIGGSHMATLVLNPDVKEFIDYLSTQNNEDFQIAEIPVSRESSIAELDCWRSTGATILGVKTSTDGYMLNPSAVAMVKSGDRIIAMGSNAQLQKIGEMLR